MDRLRGLVELTRPVNALAAGILTLIGAYVSGGIVQQPVSASAAGVATVLATGAGNAINDYFDREIDRINAPDRPIPRGDISPRGALGLSIGLFVAAVCFSLVLPRLAIAIAVVDLVALVAYTELFKGLPGVGNVVVACLGGSTFLFGGAAVESGSLQTAATLAFLAALSTITREIVKDVEDIDGDRQEGLNTLPIAIGARPALLIALVGCLLAVSVSPVPYLNDTFGRAYLAVVIPADIVLLGGTIEAFRNPSAAQSHIKYGMFLAAVAFVAGRAIV
ncbi:geranylgeranylglycerol-phosphate geranylgeranyltransferase [Halocatena pleomorpha]|uniref:Digeranylgeranylglyceryl phosphate synthase n=1 Tax=Halocatena pleomorpha TaxID=1785090 RepID=A0A3P3RIR3_9EURY|nr:geranylgeranylglycerol-phosphate geranylgeranyltransferase [Halocatena pleomorpha]RRJ33426.1 geranylgeranylglycerol-phosphate geranylgeranyltransferase [Halocatena pleomorpha]